MTDGLMFPHAVRALRLRAGMSQAAFADEMGRSQSWCSLLESGERDPSLVDLELLNVRYGITLDCGRWTLPPTNGPTS